MEKLTEKSIERANELFRVPPGASLNPINYKRVLIACKDASDGETADQSPWVFVKYNPAIYDGSDAVMHMCKEVTREQIEEADPDGTYIRGRDLVGDTQCVIVFTEPKEFFIEGVFESARDFYLYAMHADKYGLNLPNICGTYERMVWLLAIKEKQKDLWRANQILLANVEQKAFDKCKFPANGAPAMPAGPYPAGNSGAPKPVALADVSAPEFLSRAELTQLIETLMRNGADDFVAKLVAIIGSSIEYCHHVFTNPSIIKLVRGLPSFNSSMYYAFRVMYLEEIAMYARKRGPGRFIFDLDVIANLPTVQSFPKSSPYLLTTVRGCGTDSSLMLPSLLEGGRGVYNLEEFRRRLSVYSNDALKFVEWSGAKHKTALNGSVMTACAVRTPFEKFFDNLDDYFEEYYPSRKSEIKTGTKTTNLVSQLYTYVNSDSDSDDAEETDAKAHSMHARSIRAHSIRAQSIHADPPPLQTPQNGVNHKIDFSDIDLMVSCEWEDFDAVAESHFESIKRARGANLTMELVETENKHKYVVKGMHRDIDIFHVSDVPGVVVRYYLDCVRAWYDGTTVWCMPSFLTASKLGINMEIRWSSNRKDVRDTVLKYFQRGFGTMINTQDRANIISFVDNSAEWPHFNPPAQTGRPWAISRYWSEPLFHDQVRAMFNPSNSRLGIHKYLSTHNNKVDLPTIRRGSRAASRAHPDFKSKARGKVMMPASCESLAPYL